MNKIYRLKFSQEQKQVVAVSEIAKGHDHKSGSNGFLTISGIFLSLLTFFVTNAHAGLTGATIVNGNVNIQNQGNVTTITNTNNAIINWNDFSIQTHEIVNFIQDHANSSVLNRVTGGSISEINGIINSNGNVFVINPNGIIFGKDSAVNANSFLASTLDITNENFKDGNYIFNAKDNAIANIINNGAITVNQQGKVALIGGGVENAGVITAPNGEVLLLAGNSITVFDLTNPTVSYIISADSKSVNIGKIFAKGGKVNLSGFKVETDGLIEAQGGKVNLTSSELTKISGLVDVSNLTGKAGNITALSNKELFITSTAVLNASGREGGEIYIGGDDQGKGTLTLAEKTTIETDANIDTSGIADAGKTIVWGNKAVVSGNFKATSETGNGGFIETSGKYIQIQGDIKVSTKSVFGKSGTWLIDPYNIQIVATAPTTAGANHLRSFPLTAEDENSYILNTTIENFLSDNNIITINTGTNGRQAGNIDVLANITNNGRNKHQLSFIAAGNYTQNNSTISGGEAGLDLVINTSNEKTINFINSNITLGTGRLTTNNGAVNINNSNINSEFSFNSNYTTGVGVFNVNNSTLGKIGGNSFVKQTGLGSHTGDLGNIYTHNINGTLNSFGNIIFNIVGRNGSVNKDARFAWRATSHRHEGGNFTLDFAGNFTKENNTAKTAFVDFYNTNFTIVGETDNILFRQIINNEDNSFADHRAAHFYSNVANVYGEGKLAIKYYSTQMRSGKFVVLPRDNYTVNVYNSSEFALVIAHMNTNAEIVYNITNLNLNTHGEKAKLIWKSNDNEVILNSAQKNQYFTNVNVTGPGQVYFNNGAYNNTGSGKIFITNLKVADNVYLYLNSWANISNFSVGDSATIVSDNENNKLNITGYLNLAANARYELSKGYMNVGGALSLNNNASFNITNSSFNGTGAITLKPGATMLITGGAGNAHHFAGNINLEGLNSNFTYNSTTGHPVEFANSFINVGTGANFKFISKPSADKGQNNLKLLTNLTINNENNNLENVLIALSRTGTGSGNDATLNNNFSFTFAGGANIILSTDNDAPLSFTNGTLKFVNATSRLRLLKANDNSSTEIENLILENATLNVDKESNADNISSSLKLIKTLTLNNSNFNTNIKEIYFGNSTTPFTAQGNNNSNLTINAHLINAQNIVKFNNFTNIQFDRSGINNWLNVSSTGTTAKFEFHNLTNNLIFGNLTNDNLLNISANIVADKNIDILSGRNGDGNHTVSSNITLTDSSSLNIQSADSHTGYYHLIGNFTIGEGNLTVTAKKISLGVNEQKQSVNVNGFVGYKASEELNINKYEHCSTGKLELNTTQNLQIINHTNIVADIVDLKVNNFVVATTGAINTTSLAIHAVNNITLSGNIKASKDINITASNIRANSKIEAGNDLYLHGSCTTLITEPVNIRAGNFANIGGTIINIHGEVEGINGINIFGKEITTATTANLTAINAAINIGDAETKNVDQYGMVVAKHNITMQSKNHGNNTGHLISQEDNVNVKANKANLNGHIKANKNVNVTAGNITINGMLNATNDLNLHGICTTLINLNTEVQVGNFADIGTQRGITTINGNLTTNNDANFHGREVNAHAQANINVTNGSVNINDATTENATLYGLIKAKNNINISTRNRVRFNNLTTTNENINVTSKSIFARGDISAGKDVNLQGSKSTTFDSNATVSADNFTDIGTNTGNTIIGSNVSISSAKGINIHGKEITTTGLKIAAPEGTINIGDAETSNITLNTNLTAGVDINITANNITANSNINATRNVNIHGNNTMIATNSTITAGNFADIGGESSNAIINGKVTGDKGVHIHGKDIYIDPKSQNTAKETINVPTGSDTNSTGYEVPLSGNNVNSNDNSTISSPNGDITIGDEGKTESVTIDTKIAALNNVTIHGKSMDVDGNINAGKNIIYAAKETLNLHSTNSNAGGSVTLGSDPNVVITRNNPTDNPTNGSTENPTNGSTENPTNGSTENSTNGSTDNPTNGSTDNTTNNSTSNATNNATGNATNNATENTTNNSTGNATNNATGNATNNVTNPADNTDKPRVVEDNTYKVNNNVVGDNIINNIDDEIIQYAKNTIDLDIEIDGFIIRDGFNANKFISNFETIIDTVTGITNVNTEPKNITAICFDQVNANGTVSKICVTAKSKLLAKNSSENKNTVANNKADTKKVKVS